MDLIWSNLPVWHEIGRGEDDEENDGKDWNLIACLLRLIIALFSPSPTPSSPSSSFSPSAASSSPFPLLHFSSSEARLSFFFSLFVPRLFLISFLSMPFFDYLLYGNRYLCRADDIAEHDFCHLKLHPRVAKPRTHSFVSVDQYWPVSDWTAFVATKHVSCCYSYWYESCHLCHSSSRYNGWAQFTYLLCTWTYETSEYVERRYSMSAERGSSRQKERESASERDLASCHRRIFVYLFPLSKDHCQRKHY